MDTDELSEHPVYGTSVPMTGPSEGLSCRQTGVNNDRHVDERPCARRSGVSDPSQTAQRSIRKRLVVSNEPANSVGSCTQSVEEHGINYDTSY